MDLYIDPSCKDVDFSESNTEQPMTASRVAELEPSSCISEVLEHRKVKRRIKSVKAAYEVSHSLSAKAQEKLMEIHLSGGWGKMAHGIVRQIKSPRRFGLKLVDVALIMTVYDHTIAAVNSAMFSAITMADFKDETGMDESNLHKALKDLTQKGVLLKIKVRTIVFWGLNPHYFASKEHGSLRTGKSPGGKTPSGNAPSDKNGDLPNESDGQFTSGQLYQTSENQKEISCLKNLFQESREESSFCVADFPKEMLARWTDLESRGQGNKIKGEKEIFEKLFLKHGLSFFEHCYSVVNFLEEHGNGKEGIKGIIHSPMNWLEGHWETNLTRYKSWKMQQEALDEAHAHRLDKQAKVKAEKLEKERQKQTELLEAQQWTAKINAAADRLLFAYPDLADFEAFVKEALEDLSCKFTWDIWKRNGWDHPGVRTQVLEYFLDVEAGVKTTKIRPSTGAFA